MTSNHLVWHARRAAFALAMILLGGCSSLLPPPPPPDNIYLLDANLLKYTQSLDGTSSKMITFSFYFE